jgi:hypothetical protein
MGGDGANHKALCQGEDTEEDEVAGSLAAHVTLAIIGVFMIPSVQKFSAENQWLYILALVVSLVLLFMLLCPCYGDMRRKAPGNFILLGVFTLAEGFMIGTITSHYKVSEVMIAVGVTSAGVLALTIFAFQI